MNMKDKYEYESYMSALQNAAYGQQGLSGLSSLGNQRRNPFDGYDLHALPVREIEQMLVMLHQVHELKTLDTPMKAPTMRMLNKSEALKNAWNEMLLVWKLVGDE